MSYGLQVIINVVFSYLASVGFALTINVPHRALNLAGISGILGWMIYWWGFQLGAGRMLANLAGAFVIGIVGLVFARVKKCPATVFNIPALVPLVPGVPAYLAVRALTAGNYELAEKMFLRVGIVTAAIAIGFLLSTLVTEIYFKFKKREFYKRQGN